MDSPRGDGHRAVPGTVGSTELRLKGMDPYLCGVGRGWQYPCVNRR
ncbi:hypothetical protein STVIR_7094 [Streptomyces viridochromogenes Tue57]|uniref:Uncharacterized protein n=1 Tax=Streptomyces viridochromogenes Tue57 TaxID=1160705 RepID=L8P9L9_STRVR|nr:hypothetical protein STVIR_7094 [Streptomyces viridochromogenes Tue57]